ncbi:MAG: hypothetical protein H6562_16195 [Lewinellaceae bacterium]|nr:hypothetical protein [Lewinellaceae bacterium]
MLNFALKGTYQDSTGYSWDYYRDDQLDPNPDPNAFYIIPKPQFVTDTQGNPSFNITTNQTDGADNGSGVCRFDVELSVPADIQAAISSAILGNATKFPGVTKPNFIALALNKGSWAAFNLAAGGTTTTFTAAASNFGSNVASFLAHLSKTQLEACKTAFSNQGGAVDVTYYLWVPARLQSVSAVLKFDSSIAYQYQVTQPKYDSWGDQVSPGSVKALLTESNSSSVKITWGISNPPQDLVKDVTTWANDTIADLVTAEVNKAIQLQKLKSDESFNISEVSSFTNNYAENMVINWLIQPTATLPSFPNMKLNIADFETTVNTQQQHMVVSTNLPFQSDSQHQLDIVPKIPAGGGVSNPAFIKSVTITISYPTLPQSKSTYTFTANGSQAFVADFDTQIGVEWNLEYSVNYQDPNMGTVTGRINGIDMGAYTLKVEEAGILTVNFDGQQAFNSEGTKPNEIDLNFSYISQNDTTPVNQVVRLTPKEPQQSVTSLQAHPINAGYNFQATYVFPGSVTYQAPLVQNQTGFQQILPAADALHSVNLIVYVPVSQANSNPVFDATVNMWYDGTVKLPDGYSGSLPTKASPAVFTLTPNPDQTGNLFARDVFVGLATADQPLVYSASIDAASGSTDIPAQPIQNTQPSVMVSPTQRYFTLEIDPAAINWKSVAFSSVEVLVTITVDKGTASAGSGVQPERSFTWNKGETGSKYLTIPTQAGNIVSYDCKINYVTPGSATQSSTFSKQTDVTFNIPATPTTKS